MLCCLESELERSNPPSETCPTQLLALNFFSIYFNYVWLSCQCYLAFKFFRASRAFFESADKKLAYHMYMNHWNSIIKNQSVKVFCFDPFGAYYVQSVNNQKIRNWILVRAFISSSLLLRWNITEFDRLPIRKLQRN